ncbi:nuclease-related domain-containing protein [Terribacillus sp. AE2B 122]|uniref:nuclease-related domain-containing protein n=1 Tax=Terribacillus TaxID=459532 RepID=UPI0020C6C766|nr:nuclease-related domain-containing protein [Terribacillus sp. AE2B 122]
MLQKLFGKRAKSQKPNVKPEKSKTEPKAKKPMITSTRIGELGEYKINIQLDQLPKDSRYLSDILLPNPRAKSGFSQIDHLILTSRAIFVVETKNYAGTIYGERNRDKWSVNGKFPMMNPFHQNFGHIKALKSILLEVDESNFVSIVSFTRRCTFKVNEELRKIQSNDLIVYDTELSEYISRKMNVLRVQDKSPIFSDEDILRMHRKISEINITDPKIRAEHIDSLKRKHNKEATVQSETEAKCFTCNVAVSKKVEAYCKANHNRFSGKVYCFVHQRE